MDSAERLKNEDDYNQKGQEMECSIYQNYSKKY